MGILQSQSLLKEVIILVMFIVSFFHVKHFLDAFRCKELCKCEIITIIKGKISSVILL